MSYHSFSAGDYILVDGRRHHITNVVGSNTIIVGNGWWYSIRRFFARIVRWIRRSL